MLVGAVLAGGALANNICRADQIEMLNGDRYVGRVLSLGSDTLVVQSEVLGTLKLRRGQISTITLSSVPAARGGTNLNGTAPALTRSNAAARASMVARTNAHPELASAVRQLGDNSNMVQQVQQQLLGGAGPEAQAKFNDLLSGLLSGKMDMDGLRAQAKSTLVQARSARKELGGDENASMLDSCLSILENFVKETDPGEPSTNSPVGVIQQAAPAKPTPLEGE